MKTTELFVKLKIENYNSLKTACTEIYATQYTKSDFGETFHFKRGETSTDFAQTVQSLKKSPH